MSNPTDYTTDKDISELNREISKEEVKTAVFRSKPGKSVGIDEIPSEIP